MTSCCFLSREG